MTGRPTDHPAARRFDLTTALPGRHDHLAAGMQAVVARLGGRIAFGGDYNPEQWPESVWPEDVALMQQAGVNLVSVGIFSWALLEPAPGRYEFGWLDRILDLLHAGGIAVDLANGSATPPPWFSHRHPDSLLVDQDGVRRSYGGRQAFCPSSDDYRSAAAGLTSAMVDRYAGHPALAMWHVHNEYGNHNWSCYCDRSASAFRAWLQVRYGDLDTLNGAWGTSFRSQHYYDWAEILPPGAAAGSVAGRVGRGAAAGRRNAVPVRGQLRRRVGADRLARNRYPHRPAVGAGLGGRGRRCGGAGAEHRPG